MSKPKPPEGLIDARPVLQDDPDAGEHPSVTAHRGPPPAKYTRGLHDSIVGHIKAGHRPDVAAAMAGISKTTLSHWLKLGKAGDVHLWEFAQDVEMACDLAEGAAVDVVIKGFNDDSDDAKWWLERARSAHYSKQVKTIVEGQINDFMKRLEEGLPPEMFELVLAIYVGQQSQTAIEDLIEQVH